MSAIIQAPLYLQELMISVSGLSTMAVSDAFPLSTCVLMGALIGISSLLKSLHVTVLPACDKLRKAFMASVLENRHGARFARTLHRVKSLFKTYVARPRSARSPQQERLAAQSGEYRRRLIGFM
jgi:hypothetical protein